MTIWHRSRSIRRPFRLTTGTRLADRLRAAAIDRIPPETKAIYDLLRADFDKVSRERNDSTAKAIAQLDAKLDLLSSRIDEVKLWIGVDINELRQGFDKPTLPTPLIPAARLQLLPSVGQ